jgi:MAF protein
MTQTHAILLASNSPRRRELFGLSGLPFVVDVADIDESLLPGEAPMEYVRRLARQKALTVAARSPVGSLVIGSDTTVVLEGGILGKPENPADARRMLLALRGRPHLVHTGISVVPGGFSGAGGATSSPAPATLAGSTDVVTTEVWMRDYSESEIDQYIATGDPMDKAGAYGIQNQSFAPVVNMRQCYASVMGLPICALATLLMKHGVAPALPVEIGCQKLLKYPCGVSHQYLMNPTV